MLSEYENHENPLQGRNLDDMVGELIKDYDEYMNTDSKPGNNLDQRGSE